VSRRSHTILVVDDDPIILDSLAALLTLEGYDVVGVGRVADALDALGRQTFDLIISDVNMPDSDGFELLQIVRRRFPSTGVVMVTGYGTIDSAVEAIKLGAYDYLTKPIRDEELTLVVERALRQQALVRENEALRRQLDARQGLDQVLGQDYQMQRVFDLVEAVAASKVNVSIEGESGTGKSLIARVIHRRSDRREGPFVEVSCGALPETLLESELFGHVRGAFTGAVAAKEGKFAAADGGTLFLDEISSASAALQIKLLRVLQERTFEPVGSNKPQTADMRVIVASNLDLETEVAVGRFRQDLYYRINVVSISLPPLRDRLGDIPLLAQAFLERYRPAAGADASLSFEPGALQLLQRYSWPGNVRELENVVERAAVLAAGTAITVDDLPPKLVYAAMDSLPTDEYHPVALREALEHPERRIIEAALRGNGWSRQRTAEALQINRTTLYKKMKRYGLDADPAAICADKPTGSPC